MTKRVRDSHGDFVTVVTIPANELRRGDIVHLSSDRLQIVETPLVEGGRIKIAARSAKEAGGIVRRSYLASKLFNVQRDEHGPSHSTRKTAAAKCELSHWLDSHGYRHADEKKSKPAHARVIHQAPTGRPVFAAHERNHHITTSGRRDLAANLFALPPGPEEKRRGIAGRLPIDTAARARNALVRAAQMRKSGHITAAQLATVRRKVQAAWPAIA